MQVSDPGIVQEDARGKDDTQGWNKTERPDRE